MHRIRFWRFGRISSNTFFGFGQLSLRFFGAKSARNNPKLKRTSKVAKSSQQDRNLKKETQTENTSTQKQNPSTQSPKRSKTRSTRQTKKTSNQIHSSSDEDTVVSSEEQEEVDEKPLFLSHPNLQVSELELALIRKEVFDKYLKGKPMNAKTMAIAKREIDAAFEKKRQEVRQRPPTPANASLDITKFVELLRKDEPAATENEKKMVVSDVKVEREEKEEENKESGQINRQLEYLAERKEIRGMLTLLSNALGNPGTHKKKLFLLLESRVECCIMFLINYEDTHNFYSFFF